MHTPEPHPTGPRDYSRFNSASLYQTYVRNLDGSLREADVIVDGIHCAGCIRTIETGLRKAGAADAQVNFGTHRAALRWDDARIKLGDLLAALHGLGYDGHPYDPNTQEQLHRRRLRMGLARLGVAGFGAGNIMIYSVGLWAGAAYGIAPEWWTLFRWLSVAICLPVLIFSGWPFLHGAWRSIRARRFTMDTLISLGLLSTFGYSTVVLAAYPAEETYFESVVMVIFFLLIGRFLETLAQSRSGSVTEALMNLQARTATRVSAGGEEVVPVESLHVGDRLIVRTGEAVPADGVVRSGAGELDESALTGEARLRSVQPGDTVLGATINRGPMIEMEATRVGAETALARVCRLVEQAQTEKAPIQHLADRVASRSVLVIASLAALTLAYWQWFHVGASTQPGWISAIAVLIIACPCALGLATPVAVLAGSALAARRGILVKGGAVLERAARVTDVVLDKTGTLTTGKLSVTALESLGATAAGQWFALAAAIERRALHPIAEALQAHFGGISAAPLAAATEVKVAAGRGVRGCVGGIDVCAGNERWMRELGIAFPPSAPTEESTDTVVLVALDGKAAGRIRLSDPLRPGAARVVSSLQDQGMRVHLFSGDRAPAVAEVARRTGIADARASMLPDQKLEAIREMQGRGRVVAMVGDGINDAPALAQADLAVAVSTGSDVTLEAADVILMRSRLDGAVEALEIARHTLRAIRQNLALSIGYNAVAVPLAMAGLVNPLVAALAMSSSSLLVVGNALRLRLSRKAGFANAPALRESPAAIAS
jgi:Cu2+-exporting ATPase